MGGKWAPVGRKEWSTGHRGLMPRLGEALGSGIHVGGGGAGPQARTIDKTGPKVRKGQGGQGLRPASESDCTVSHLRGSPLGTPTPGPVSCPAAALCLAERPPQT